VFVGPDQQGGAVGVDVAGVESQGFPGPHAGHGQQGDDGSHRGPHERVGEHMSAGVDQRVDLVLGVDVGPAPVLGGTQRVGWWHLHVQADRVAVAGQAPDRAEPLALVGVLQRAVTVRPAQGLRDGETRTPVRIGLQPFEETAGVAFLLHELEAQRPSLSEVRLQRRPQVSVRRAGGHGSLPHAGASGRSGVMSTRA
jgi:hypothetical protein